MEILGPPPRPLLAAGPLGSTVGCSGINSQGLATIQDPLRIICADLGPDRQMSAVETGRMSPVETEQMSAVKTRQMRNSGTGQRPVLPVDICLV